jgi:hypothetical protein
MRMNLPPDGSEQRNEMLDPHRREERSDAATEITGRLFQKGIDVSNSEDPSALADLLSAVERFESAVEKQGGDLMVNTPTSADPQNPDFVVPSRNADETLESYIVRIDAATAALS